MSERFSRSWRELLLLAMIALAVWLPRGFKLDQFVTTDEVIWLMRSANFYYALGQRDFTSTVLNKTPGVNVLWAETAAFLWKFPQYRGFGQGQFDSYIPFEKFLVSKNVDPHELLVAGRVLMVLGSTATLVVAFVIARRLLGVWPAVTAFLLIAFEPFHLGLTRLAHTDGPLSNFMLLSSLAFLSYVYLERRMSYIVLSAAAAALAWLTKLPGVLLVPWVGLIALVRLGEALKAQWDRRKQTLARWLRQYGLPLLLWGTILAVLFVALWPMIWQDPVGILLDMVYVPMGSTGQISAVDEESLSRYYSEANQYFVIRYPKAYLERATPVVLLGLLAALVAFAAKVGLFAEGRFRRLAVDLFLFVVVYTVALTVIVKWADRYYIPTYIVLDVIAALGFVSGAQWLLRNRNETLRRAGLLGLTAVVLLAQMALALPTFPYYFSYFNPLLYAGRKKTEAPNVGYGEGLDQAARYLNQKPNAEKLTAMSWYGIGCFSYFFEGEARWIFPGGKWSESKASELRESDYLVTYVNQWRRRMPEKLFEALEGAEPEHSVWIDGIEYARIYAVDELPPEVFEP